MKHPTAKPFDRIVKLCAVRERSARELQDRLVRDGYGEAEAHDAVHRAVECGLVDDMRFADILVRSRVSAGKGINAICKDLAKFGIDPESLPDWPYGYALDEDAQVKSALEYLNTHPPAAKDAYSAAFRKLMGKGYTQSVATRATRRWYEATQR